MKEKSIIFRSFLFLLILPITIASSMNIGETYALILGISDYNAISDLRYWGEDANDWFYYLTTIGYDNVILLGEHSNTFLQNDGLATKSNVKDTLNNIVANAGSKNTISIISSEHWSGDHKEWAYFVCGK